MTILNIHIIIPIVAILAISAVLAPGEVAAALLGAASLIQRYFSNTASFVLCVFLRVKDHHNLQSYSPLLKKTCVRQVELDKWFPLNMANEFTRTMNSWGDLLGDDVLWSGS